MIERRDSNWIQVGPIADDSAFDIAFWQAQGPEAIFEAAWQMVKDYHLLRGGSSDELELHRSPITIKPISG